MNNPMRQIPLILICKCRNWDWWGWRACPQPHSWLVGEPAFKSRLGQSASRLRNSPLGSLPRYYILISENIIFNGFRNKLIKADYPVLNIFPLLSPQPAEIYTRDGNSNGRPCEFPFLVNGTWHHECMRDGDHNGLWCATTFNYEYEGKWGICLQPGMFGLVSFTCGNKWIPFLRGKREKEESMMTQK